MASVWRNLEYNKKAITLAAKSRNFLITAVKTTGLSKDSEIIEVSFLRCRFFKGEFRICESFETGIRPKTPLSEKISDMNGVTNEVLSKAPYEEEIFPLISSFIGEEPFICMYGLPFGMKFLSAAFEKNGKTLSVSGRLDLHAVAKDLFCCDEIRDMKLETVAQAYGTEAGLDFRTAGGCSRASVRVLNKAVEEIKNGADSSEDVPVTVTELYCSEGFRGNRRLYVSTNAGRFMYSFAEDRYSTLTEGLNLKKIQMASAEKQIFDAAGVTDYKELRKKCEAIGKGKVS